MSSLDERPRYTSGFGVSWLRLPILLLAAPAAAAVAWLLHFLFVHGFYLIMVVPLFAALALAGIMFGLVAAAHCRNRWLAGLVGLLAGLTAYLGYYQLCLNDFAPPDAQWRVDVLPRFIEARIRTDVAIDVGRGDNAGQKKPFVFMNVVTFVMELLFVAIAPAAAAVGRAGRAYSPEAGRWLAQEMRLLPGGFGPQVRLALEDGSLAEFVASAPPPGHPQLGSRIILEYVAAPGVSPLDHPVYLTVTRGSTGRTRIGAGPLGKVLRQVALEPAEVFALRPLFPQLNRLLGGEEPAARELPGIATAIAAEVARITPVPEPYRQRVRTRHYSLLVNLLDLTPVVFFLGGAGLAGWGAWLASEGDVALGCLLVALGIGPFIWGIYTGLFCMSVASNRWIERRLRSEVGQRPDPLVDPRDPDALYVSLIPRESFAQVRWTLSSDVLLLKVDAASRRVLMEGDIDRYEIPAAAIAECEPQCFFAPMDPHQATQLWMARLMVQTPEGQRELLLSVAHTKWTPATNSVRRRNADDLCRRIDALGG
jgi:hypothetical protein